MALALFVGCAKESYQAATGYDEYDTYYIYSSGHTSTAPVFTGMYDMYIYRDIEKVMTFGASNDSSGAIYHSRNFVDRTTVHYDSTGYEYKIYDFEFDLVVGTNDDGSEILDHYAAYVDMCPEAVQQSDGSYAYNTRLVTKTASDGTVTFDSNYGTNYYTYCIDKTRLMAEGDEELY